MLRSLRYSSIVYWSSLLVFRRGGMMIMLSPIIVLAKMCRGSRAAHCRWRCNIIQTKLFHQCRKAQSAIAFHGHSWMQLDGFASFNGEAFFCEQLSCFLRSVPRLACER